MSKLISGDLRGLELPRDLAVLRHAAVQAVAKDQSLNSLYAALAAEHPLALGELVYGPKALDGKPAVLSALNVVEILEKGLQPKALYPRLAKLAPTASAEIFEAAVNRFPSAPWVLKLGKQLQLIPGLLQLEEIVNTDAFEAVCFAHARNGHFQALLQMAKKGHVEPAAALFAVGARNEALHAANLALEQAPNAPVIPWLSAVGGLCIDTWLCGLLPHLKSKAAVENLLAASRPFPHLHHRLGILLPAVR
jgi:hypothetical protein